MIFNKKEKNLPKTVQKTLTDGRSALKKVLQVSSTRIFDSNDPAAAMGYALTGNRAAAFTYSTNPSVYQLLQSYRTRNLAIVIFHELSTSSDFLKSFDYSDDFIVLQPSTAQELIDFALIAQSVTEQSLIPVICLYDKTVCADVIEQLQIPGTETIEQLLGKDDELIETPTAAQRILFGAQRKRIPAIINTDRPLGSGLLHNNESTLNRYATRKPFFKDHVPELLANARKKFSELTGRYYEPIKLFNTEKADYLIVCSGPISSNLIEFCNAAQKALSLKLGIVTISVINPFDRATISHIVKKKTGLTILEDMSALNLHLYHNIKSAMNIAWENGRITDSSLINPGYAVYSKTKDQPDVYHGFYIQNIDSPSLLLAISKNMVDRKVGKRHFFTSLNFSQNQSRFPKLETLQQRIHQAYPRIDELALLEADTNHIRSDSDIQQKIEFYLPVTREINEFSHLIASDYIKSGIKNIRVLGNEQQAEILPYNKLTLSYSNTEQSVAFTETKIVVLSNMLFEGNIEHIAEKGSLLINSSLSAETIWQRLSENNRRIIKNKQLRLFHLDAKNIADEIAVIPANREMTAHYALYGALLKIDTFTNLNSLKERKENLKKIFTENRLFASQILEILKSIQQGFDAVKPLNWNSIPEFTGLKNPEEDTPWTVKQVKNPDGTIYDLARTWDSVGYLYRMDQRKQILNDPFLASNTLPAFSSSFRDLAVITEKVPQIIPERCSGCGMCWSQCPDSALPSMITTTDDILKSALDALSLKGKKLIQVQRIADNLSKQAYKLFSTDDLNRFLSAGSLFQEAFNHLSQKMGLKDDQLRKLQDEFQLVLNEIAALPLVRTTMFFESAHNQVKGSGKILTINVNPAACKGCTSCVNVCPEKALEMVESTNDVINNYRRNFDFQNQLVESSPEPFINPENSDSLINVLLHKKNYYTLSGGDNAFPGSGVKTTIHLLMSSVEAVMNERYEKFTDKLDETIRLIQEKIQGRLETSVRINEFEEFGSKLSQLEGKDLEVSDLINLISPKDQSKKTNAKQIKRLTELSLKLKTLKQNYKIAANGNGRARLVSVLNSSGLLYWCAGYPFNPFANPWINTNGNNLASTIKGLFEGVTASLADDFKILRKAELELKDAWVEQESEASFETFSWQDFNEYEKQLCPPALLILDNETLSSQSLQSIAAAGRNERPLYICVLNNMTRSGSLENLLNWTLNYSDRYILHSTAANPGHLMSGIIDMVQSGKPGFLHLYACEPHMQGLAEYEANRHHKRAINSRVFPLFKYNPDRSPYFTECFSLDGNPAVESDWSSDASKDSSEKFTFADWAVHEKEFRNEFRTISKSDWDDSYIQIADYIDLSAEKQNEFKPYITIKDINGQNHTVAVSKKIAAYSAAAKRNWNLLQEIAGIKTFDRSYVDQKWQKKLDDEISNLKSQLEADYNTQLAYVQNEHWQIYHNRLTEKLKTLHDLKNKNESAKKTLADYAKGKKLSNRMLSFFNKSMKTFRHGIHPGDYKDLTRHIAIERMPFTDELVIPLSQHLGAPSRLLVKEGDKVYRGQIIGEPAGFVSIGQHAPVTGTVKAIEMRHHPSGKLVESVIISRDPYSPQTFYNEHAMEWESLTPGELISLIQHGGFVGLGGAAFPTHVKLSVPEGKKAKFLIINGVECEPYLTSDHRVMLEQFDDVFYGIRILEKVLGCERFYIGIENNKDDAIALLNKRIPADMNGEVVALQTKYPQGAEKMLIEAVLKREVPSGKLPIDVEVVVQNVGTIAGIGMMFRFGQPLIERVVTITGPGIEKPSNLLIPIGTKLADVLDYCGGLKENTRQVLFGGPMMGAPQVYMDVPIMKGTSGILCLTDEEVTIREEYPCIRCLRCVDACPVYLNPSRLGALAKTRDYEGMLGYHVMDCVECGSCSYVCPSNIPLVQRFRVAKALLREKQAKQRKAS